MRHLSLPSASKTVGVGFRSFFVLLVGFMLFPAVEVVAQTLPSVDGFSLTPPEPPHRSPSNVIRMDDVERLTTMGHQRDPLNEIPLLPGTNLISTPKTPLSSDPEVVLSPITGSLERAYAYDACGADPGWRVFDPLDPDAATLTEVGPELAIQIEATEVAELPVDGVLPDTTSIPLCAGWNLIGFPAAQPRAVGSVFHAVLPHLVRVFEYDPFDPADPWAFWDVQAPAWANDLAMLRPGYGYWVLVDADLTLDIRNVGDAPTAAFSAPLDLDAVTAPTEIFGSVRSDLLESWLLRYRGIGEGQWIELSTGDAPIEGKLGDFDPTLLLNGLYELELVATDVQGQQVETSMALVVEGSMKIGQLRLSFVDLELPFAGLDIRILRTYDSRQRHLSNDFGPGWSLDIRQGSYRNNRPPGDGWEVLPGEGPLGLPCQHPRENKSHLTTIRLSDREVYHFSLNVVDLGTVVGGCIGRAEFEFLYGPLPRATLEIVGNDQVLFQNGSEELLDVDRLETFVPEEVRLTTLDGRVFDLHLSSGVTALEDANGNALAITPQGITHSDGRGVQFVRDPEGRIEQFIDPQGNVHSYLYDADGDLVRSTDRLGEATQFEYVEDHLLHRILTADGRQLAAATFSQQRLQRLCNGTGDCTELQHDIEGRAETVIDATQRSLVYRYDERGNVIQMTDALGHTIQQTYNPRDQVVTHANPLGHVTRSTYDADGNLMSVVLPHEAGDEAADFTTTFTYDGFGRMTSALRPDGVRRELLHDEAGNLLEIRDGSGQVLRSWTYDSKGLALTEADLFGTEHYSSYSVDGQPERVVERDGNVISATYDALGGLASMQMDGQSYAYTRDALGREVRAQYDDFAVTTSYGLSGQVSRIDNELVGPVDRKEDLNGRLIAWRSPNGAQQSHGYDAAGRLVNQTSPTGATTTYHYDEAGRLARVAQPDGGDMSFVRDAAGRVTRITDPLGRSELRTYTPSGRLASRTNAAGRQWQMRSGPGWSETEDPLGRIERFELGPEGELEHQIHADGTTLQVTYLDGAPPGQGPDYVTAVVDEGGYRRDFTYGTTGQLVAAEDLGEHAWSFTYPSPTTMAVQTPSGADVHLETYDARDRLLSRRYGDGSSLNWTYGVDSDPSRLTLASGATVDFTYTGTGQLAGRVTSDGVVQTFQRDLDHRLTSMQDATGIMSTTYDAAGRLALMAHSDGSRVRYVYDLAGQLTELGVTPPGGQPETDEQRTVYAYDLVGNLITIQDALGGLTHIEYDAVHRPVRRVFPNGIETLWQYDLRDRITLVEHRRSDGSVLVSYTYERGAMGEPTRVTREDGRWSDYTYDAAFRVASEHHFDSGGGLVKQLDYLYSAAGHRIAVIEDGVRQDAQYNNVLQLTNVQQDGVDIESVTWDADGRRSSQQRGATTWSFDYNALDQMVSLQILDGASGPDTWTYSYDAGGRRTQIASPAGGPERHLWAPMHGTDLDLLHSLTAGGSTTHVVHWGDNPQLAIHDGQPRYFLEDGLGNVAAHWDEGASAGHEMSEVRYSAYGVVLEGDVALPGGEGGFGYQGQWHDPTGLVHLRARQYDPESGLFLSRDPAEGDPWHPESFHPYLFANANPMVYADPTGLFTLVEVNVNLSADNILQTAKFQAKNKVREEVRDRIEEIATDLLTDFIESSFGLQTAGIEPLSRLNSQLGELFESMTVDIFCETAGHVVGHLTWLEPGIDEDSGDPLSDGYSCEQRGEGGRGRPPKGRRHPDFVLDQQAPRFPGKSYLVGEIKYGLNSYRSAWRRSKQLGQWDAMRRYAKHHGYPPHVVALIAFKGGKKAAIDLNWLQNKIRNAQIAGIIIVIRDSISSKSKGKR